MKLNNCNQSVISGKTPTVVGIGEALWDVLPDGKKVGGAPANFAYHVSQFGIDSCAVSALGKDRLGEELAERFEERGLNTIMPAVDYPTGTVIVEVDQLGIPSYSIKHYRMAVDMEHSPDMRALYALLRPMGMQGHR